MVSSCEVGTHGEGRIYLEGFWIKEIVPFSVSAFFSLHALWFPKLPIFFLSWDFLRV